MLGIIVFMLALPVFAEPDWGSTETWTQEPWLSYKHTPSGLRIVKDPLIVANYPAPSGPLPLPYEPTSFVPTLSGWIIFVCSDDKEPKNAPEGFDYSITAKGLSAKTSYNVKAYPQLGSSDYGTVGHYDLGTLLSDRSGEGEISGYIDLSPGFYLYQITVEKSDGTIVLSMLPPFTYYDPALDTVLPFPPEPIGPWTLGELLWYTGDLADMEVVK